jgi:uncharacterized protein YjbJ (UPF0337 family)
MNTDQLKGKWDQLKGDAKVRWGKLTDDDLKSAEGHTEKLVGRIQERYGLAKEEAEKQVEEWHRSMGQKSAGRENVNEEQQRKVS